MNIPASALELLAERWERKLQQGALRPEECVLALRAVLLLPNAAPGMRTFQVAMEIFGPRAAQTLAEIQAATDDARGQCVSDSPAIGDYVLATKWHDGDPGDHWGLGFYEGERGGRHFVRDAAGHTIRPGGFRRVARIRRDVGAWLLGVAAKELELSPPGTVNLWTMLTPDAFAENER